MMRGTSSLGSMCEHIPPCATVHGDIQGRTIGTERGRLGHDAQVNPLPADARLAEESRVDDSSAQSRHLKTLP